MVLGLVLPSERDAVGESRTTLIALGLAVVIIIVLSILGKAGWDAYDTEKGKWLDANALYGVELRAKEFHQAKEIEFYYLYRDTKAQLGECEYLLKSYLSEKQTKEVLENE